MSTYQTRNTGVIHWMDFQPPDPTKLACHSPIYKWDSDKFDPAGVPADVTCCNCRETRAWLDAVEAMESP